MRVTFHVNAMVTLEGDDTTVLCDPWVTFDDYSPSGFYNFPRARLTPEDVVAIEPDVIYISHTHPDHFDPITLGLFPKDTTIVVSHYAANFTERAVMQLGFTDVRTTSPGKWLPLNNGDRCWIEPSRIYPECDSIALFQLSGDNAVNANDNVIHREQCEELRSLAGNIDIGLLPSGAHGPYPMFFENLSPAEKMAAAAKRAQTQKESFVSYIEALQPRYVVPIAGGIVAGGEKAKQYGYSGISPRSEVTSYALERVKFEPILLSEGCSFDSRTGERSGTYVEATFANQNKYLDDIASRPGLFSPQGLFYVDPSQRIDLSRLIFAARQNQSRWQERLETTSITPYYFDVGEETLYRLCLGDDKISRVREKDIDDQEYEIYRLPYELLLGMLTRHYHWSNVNTQHMSFYRKGDKMDPELLLLMNFLQV